MFEEIHSPLCYDRMEWGFLFFLVEPLIESREDSSTNHLDKDSFCLVLVRKKKLGSAELASVRRIDSSVRVVVDQSSEEDRPESFFRQIHPSHAQSLH